MRDCGIYVQGEIELSITNDLMNFKELEGLSEAEKEYAIKILQEISDKGESEKLNNLLYEDYEEIPVDIETFLHDQRYLGKALINEEGKYTLFPYWEKVLKEMFPNNLDTKYNTAVFTGGIGLGKSTVAVISILYILYRTICLKNPYLHYGLQDIDLITFAFINITLDAAKGVAWDKCQQMLQKSPWFMEHGTMSKSGNPTWKPPKGIELICGSLPRHIIGRAVLGCFIDEVSFQPNADVQKQINKAKELVSAANTRMQSRFMKGEKSPALLCLASSKRTEQSYLETFIANKRKNESKTTIIIDEPQWVIRTDKDSPNKFKVAVGNKFLNSELLPLGISEEEVQIYRNRGYTIMDVPMGYYENFVDDIEKSLTDIAGISTTNALKFISGARWSELVTDGMKNPFSREVLKIGNGKDDAAQYYDFYDDSIYDSTLKSMPLFIHLDMSLSGDKTGIAGVWIIGKARHQEGVPDSKELFYRLAFSVAIEAPKGHEISFEKNRMFIRWLKQKGYRIRGISSDTFQSADLKQTLLSEGYDYQTISVDRVHDRTCEPYQYFRSSIYEKRLKTYQTVLLTEEVINLERDGNGKIDHPMGGTVGSKDIADAVAGAMWNASQHAQEFEFNYGETLDSIVQVSSMSPDSDKKQVTVDFEEELKKIFNPLGNINSSPKKEDSQKTQKSPFMDFGMGRASALPQQYISQGIIVPGW